MLERSQKVITGFIGGGGASGVLYILLAIAIGIVIVHIVVLGLVLLYLKHKAAAVSAAVILGVGTFAFAQHFREQLRLSTLRGDADVELVLLKGGSYILFVDGVRNYDPLVSISANVDFSVILPDKRDLRGEGILFRLSSDKGTLILIEIGGVDFSREDKLAFLSGLSSLSEGKAFDGLTDEYLLRFTKPNSDYEWFSVSHIRD